jgi:hypothetical protein
MDGAYSRFSPARRFSLPDCPFARLHINFENYQEAMATWIKTRK